MIWYTIWVYEHEGFCFGRILIWRTPDALCLFDVEPILWKLKPVIVEHDCCSFSIVSYKGVQLCIIMTWHLLFINNLVQRDFSLHQELKESQCPTQCALSSNWAPLSSNSTHTKSNFNTSYQTVLPVQWMGVTKLLATSMFLGLNKKFKV